MENPYERLMKAHTKEQFEQALALLSNEGKTETKAKTRVSCTFVKCKHNNYGKLGICQCKYIQMGELVSPGSRSGEPVCVYYKRKANET